MNIKSISARQILDSRGNPTVEADVFLDSGQFGRASVPSGASTGVHEALELRDGGEDYGGKGVSHAVDNIESEISDSLIGKMADDQYLIDQTMIELDGTDDKSRLGANSILAVSLAVAHAAANERKILLYAHINDIADNPTMSIPLPMMNVLNGGQHASKSSDFQEFMIIPTKVETYKDAVKIGSEIFQALKEEISKAGGTTTVGDEGGFTFEVSSNTEMLDFLSKSTRAAGYTPGEDVGYALDVAASEFYFDNIYSLKTENRQINANELIEYYESIVRDYPVISIEDGIDQDDWQSWEEMTKRMSNTQLVGDDLLVTNQFRLKQAIEQNAGNAILIKPNQIGTLTETINTIKLAKLNKWNTIISHRSGETEDVTIAHLAIGAGAGQIKTGSLSRSERTAKHNEIMRIESMDKNLNLANPFSV